jgi:hypothetical protein
MSELAAILRLFSALAISGLNYRRLCIRESFASGKAVRVPAVQASDRLNVWSTGLIPILSSIGSLCANLVFILVKIDELLFIFPPE